VNREINPIIAVIIIVALAGVAAGAYFIIKRPRDTYDPKKAAAAAAARGSRAYQSMTGSNQPASGGMPYSPGMQRGSSGGGYSPQGYSGGRPTSGGMQPR